MIINESVCLSVCLSINIIFCLSFFYLFVCPSLCLYYLSHASVCTRDKQTCCRLNVCVCMF